MKASYLNNLTSSFYLWLDHEILSRGQAFINYTGKLYNAYDPNFDGISSIYSAPFKQWVYDSSINNAIIPSGINNGNTFIQRGVSGLAMDFNHGRVIFNGNILNKNSNFTTSYSLKEFNIYLTDEKEDRLLFENSYSVRPKFNQITGGLSYQDLPYPCIFIKTRNMENIPYAFAGEDQTETMVRCIILAKDSFSLDSVISIMNDSARKVFPLLNPVDLPFNYLGDFKVGNNFNYVDLCKNQSPLSYVYIDRVTVSKLDESTNMYINKKVIIALVDFELSDIRTPRIY